MPAEKTISISQIAEVCGLPCLLAQDEWMQSPGHSETGEKNIRVILVGEGRKRANYLEQELQLRL